MKKVLVVDDDDLVRPTVSAMLSALNFEVVEGAMTESGV
jgi:CheY-like chemotaxis protein